MSVTLAAELLPRQRVDHVAHEGGERRRDVAVDHGLHRQLHRPAAERRDLDRRRDAAAAGADRIDRHGGDAQRGEGLAAASAGTERAGKRRAALLVERRGHRRGLGPEVGENGDVVAGGRIAERFAGGDRLGIGIGGVVDGAEAPRGDHRLDGVLVLGEVDRSGIGRSRGE